LAKQGKKLKDGYNAIANELGMAYTACKGLDARTITTFESLDQKSLVSQEMLKRGVLWGGFHNMSFSHTDADVQHALACYAEVLPILEKAVKTKTVREMLRGEPVEPVFRKISKFDTKPVKRA